MKFLGIILLSLLTQEKISPQTNDLQISISQEGQIHFGNEVLATSLKREDREKLRELLKGRVQDKKYFAEKMGSITVVNYTIFVRLASNLSFEQMSQLLLEGATQGGVTKYVFTSTSHPEMQVPVLLPKDESPSPKGFAARVILTNDKKVDSEKKSQSLAMSLTGQEYELINRADEKQAPKPVEIGELLLDISKKENIEANQKLFEKSISQAQQLHKEYLKQNGVQVPLFVILDIPYSTPCDRVLELVHAFQIRGEKNIQFAFKGDPASLPR